MKTQSLKKMRAVNNLLLAFVFAFNCVLAQHDSLTENQVNRKRLRTATITAGVAYTGMMLALNETWYKAEDRQPFAFFNDNAEWNQMDKAGHFYTAFYLSYASSQSLRWCNVPSRKADLAGALIGFGLMMPIELLDGFSVTYGASAGDLLANAAGSVFFIGQKLHWKELRIYPKFSFHRTGYAPQRPDVLGNGLPDEILKDYNGQTYWLSFDMDKFIRFPTWLNIAVGYGSEGHIYARNPRNIQAGYSAYRQYYLSPDIDLTAIKSRSKLIRTLLWTASLIKLPAPAIEFSRNGTRFHFAYF